MILVPTSVVMYMVGGLMVSGSGIQAEQAVFLLLLVFVAMFAGLARRLKVPSPSLIARPPARTSNPFTTPERVFDSGEILERIATVRDENLKRLNDDIDILKAHLKTQRAPKAAIEALEGLTVEQHVSWKKAVERIKKRLDE